MLERNILHRASEGRGGESHAESGQGNVRILLGLGIIGAAVLVAFWVELPYEKLLLAGILFIVIVWAMFYRAPLVRVKNRLEEMSPDSTVPMTVYSCQREDMKNITLLDLSSLVTHLYSFLGNPQLEGKGVIASYTSGGASGDKIKVVAFKLDPKKNPRVDAYALIRLIHAIRNWKVGSTFSTQELTVLDPIRSWIEETVFGKDFLPAEEEAEENKIGVTEYCKIGKVHLLKYRLLHEGSKSEFRYKFLWGYQHWFFEVSSQKEAMVEVVAEGIIQFHNRIARKS